jgi:hypothetical protein
MKDVKSSLTKLATGNEGGYDTFRLRAVAMFHQITSKQQILIIIDHA